jgi:tellurite resistance protein
MSDLATAKQALKSDLADVTSPKLQALIEAMFLAATADGEFAPEESLQFSATIEALTDKQIDRASIQKRVAELSALLKKEGRPARLSAVAQRLPAGMGRETALILAAAITASDGQVVERENDLLADLAEALEVPQTRATELIAKVHRTAQVV